VYALQVRSYAVEVLQKTDDEELLYYLLQLVQVGAGRVVAEGQAACEPPLPSSWLPLPAMFGFPHARLAHTNLPPPADRHSPIAHCLQALGYEAADDSRLASFLVARARHSITVASFLFWYLLTELGDDAFGPRASIVQVEGRGRAGQGRAGCLAGWLTAPAAARACCLLLASPPSRLYAALLLPMPACCVCPPAPACPHLQSAIIGATGQQASPTEECIHQQVMLMARLKHISETVSVSA
jgi:hypothetical protein